MDRPRKPLADRLWSHVDTSAGPDACWPWTGYIKTNGYGQFAIGRGGEPRSQLAHRIAYELSGREIPEGLVIDHLCRNRRCCNPSHMEPVTVGTNLLRGTTITARNATTTTCPSGHPYTPDNTMVSPEGWRKCRECHRLRQSGGVPRQRRYGPNRRRKES